MNTTDLKVYFMNAATMSLSFSNLEATAGLVVYDTSTNKLKCYDGSSWNNLF